MLNADTEVDLLDIQSVEKASPVREESEVNQLTYFNTDFYRYIAAIMTHDKTKSKENWMLTISGIKKEK